MENLNVDILGGTAFMECNDVTVHLAKHQVLLYNGSIYTYGSPETSSTNHNIRPTHLIRAPEKTTVGPGKYIELELPDSRSPDNKHTLESRTSCRYPFK